MTRITHPRHYFQKLSQNDVIMMMIESDAQVMTEVTLHTMFIYITLGTEDKLDADSFDTFIETVGFSCIVHDDDFIISVMRLGLISRSEVNY